MKLKGIQLSIQNPEKTIGFYTKILGFNHLKTIKSDIVDNYILQAKNTDFIIELIHNKVNNKAVTYKMNSFDNYWKFSLFVDDIQRTYNIIKSLAYTIGEPFQFGKIAYLSHTKDTENHHIEFIQKTFKQNTPNITTSTDLPLKEQTVFGLITIRTQDPIKSIRFYENVLRLKLMVRMYVERGNGFTLYFLGDAKLTPPNSDIDAIENREWMYQQNHCFIEIQHYWGSETDNNFQLTVNSLGLKAILFKSKNINEIIKILISKNISFSQENGKVIMFKTPDNHIIYLE